MPSHETLCQTAIARPPFIIEPWLPQGGVVLLHAKTSVGKSPLTWLMSRCVGAGEPFLGFPTLQPGSVLYLEFETPAMLAQPRVRLLPSTPNWWFEFLRPCNILIDPQRQMIARLCRELDPRLVVVNSLRRVKYGDEADPNLPSKIYSCFQQLAPHACILFTHHDRKRQGKDGPDDPDEDFSGSQAWRDLTQITIHLTRGPGWLPTRQALRMKMTKSQVCRLLPPVDILLDDNGTSISRIERSQNLHLRPIRSNP